MDNFLIGKKHIHFIGVGGSGMYPLAQILHGKGYYLTGSDNNETQTLDAVRQMGIPVFLGHDAEHINGADLIIYSAAIMKDNPELIAAKEKNIPIYERSELLGLISRFYNHSYCVCGTHGKTTATSMLTHIFLAERIDISAVIGGKLKAINGSGITGNSDTFICEACEFSNTFLKLNTTVSIILNIDQDHLDFFKTMDNLIASFTTFCDQTRDAVIYNGDDKNTRIALENSNFYGDRISFGWSEKNNYYPKNIRKLSDFHTEFDLYHNNIRLDTLSIRVPGQHNVINAVAAATAALYAGCSLESVKTGLSEYKGTGRRFELLDVVNGITVADDYAHHPAELTVTLKTAKEMSFKRVWAVHQPFTFSRTATMLDEFADALSIADQVVLTEIMGGREINTYNIHTSDLASKIDGCVWFETFDLVAEYVTEHAQNGDLVITLGCGDVNKVADLIVKKLKKLSNKNDNIKKQ